MYSSLPNTVWQSLQQFVLCGGCCGAFFFFEVRVSVCMNMWGRCSGTFLFPLHFLWSSIKIRAGGFVSGFKSVMALPISLPAPALEHHGYFLLLQFSWMLSCCYLTCWKSCLKWAEFLSLLQSNRAAECFVSAPSVIKSWRSGVSLLFSKDSHSRLLGTSELESQSLKINVQAFTNCQKWHMCLSNVR